MIHYDLPSSSEIFVHRSGRTGRARKKGAAILIYSEDQFRTVKTIERDVGCKFTEVILLFLFPRCSFLFLYYYNPCGTKKGSLFSFHGSYPVHHKGHWNVVPL